MKQAAA